MFVGEYAIYNNEKKGILNRKKLILELPPKSNYIVTVSCPECGEMRNSRYAQITRAGHHICLKCMRKLNARKHIEIGTVSGRLTVLRPSDVAGYSICRCECGTVRAYLNYSIKVGKVGSCGCLKRENFTGVKRVKGSNHGMWRGGVTGLRGRHMQSGEYKNWRRMVFERDNYTCQKCGQVGYELNAHHIYEYSGHEKKRTDIENGTTFCAECHREYHKIYGRKSINCISLTAYIQYERVKLDGKLGKGR